jgi:anti-sigma regulatory factor (Ser/Thr protein kinase)
MLDQRFHSLAGSLSEQAPSSKTARSGDNGRVTAQSQQDELELELPSRAPSVGKARDALAGVARQVGAPEDDVKLAVSEAVGNAVMHAFRGREPGRIVLRARNEEGRLVVTVADDGNGMSPNLDSPGLGLGLSLITRLALDVHFDSSDRGTTVSMTFPAGEPGMA